MAQEPGSRLHALGSNPWFIDRSMKILGLIEERFDESDNQGFRVFFPGHGLAVDFASYFCGNPALEYEGNGKTCRLRGDLCVSKISLSDDSGLILMGGCAMDRPRYQACCQASVSGDRNMAPAVVLMREAVQRMEAGMLAIGTICHSLLWE